MAKKDYLPKGDSQYSFWYDNFGNKLVGHGPTLGITNDEINVVQADALSVRTKISEVQAIKLTTQAVVHTKDETLSESRQKTRKLVNRLKAHPDYSVAIGEELGIVPPDVPGIPGGVDNAKPDFEITVLGDRNRLDWMKREFDGVVIEGKRGNETTWTHLDKDMKSPYEDMRKNLIPNVPETRIYRMRYIIGDEEVGQWSDEVKVVCGFEEAE
ncbi:MAG: hypothetical protein KGZ58_02685 [Ignavibacteriales bacterium]|nr:hypothetical protein [Ignavibacteriales bacterium]